MYVANIISPHGKPLAVPSVSSLFSEVETSLFQKSARSFVSSPEGMFSLTLERGAVGERERL